MARRMFADEFPGLITTREQYDSIPSADYDALKTGPLVRDRHGLAPLGAGADWHLRFEFQHLRFAELARDVRRNDPYVGQGVERMLDNVLQGGPTPDPQTGSDDVDLILKEGWSEWGGDKMKCHSLQTMNWTQMRRVSMDAMIVDGDLWQIMLKGDSAELMEAHRVRKPQNTVKNVVFGVLKDDYGRPQQVWFTKENLQPAMQLNNVGATRPVPIRDEDGFEQVMQLVDRGRATQTRGISKFAPIFKHVTLMDDSTYAELVKLQVQSCIAFLRELPLSNIGPTVEAGTAGNVYVDSTPTSTGGSQKLVEEIFPGMTVVGKPGEMLKAFSPNAGGADWINFSMVVLAVLSINLHMPLAVFLLDASKGNFANMRGVINQARTAWRRLAQIQIDCQERPTYLWRVRALINENSKRGKLLRKLLDQNPDILPFKHGWHAPELEYIDPLKDVSAAALELSTGQSSPRRVCNRINVDWKQLAKEIVADRSLLIELAIAEAERINKLHPEAEVDWRLLAPMGIPSGVTMQIAIPGAEESAEGGTKNAA